MLLHFSSIYFVSTKTYCFLLPANLRQEKAKALLIRVFTVEYKYCLTQ